jgi:hypothetical protein
VQTLPLWGSVRAQAYLKMPIKPNFGHNRFPSTPCFKQFVTQSGGWSQSGCARHRFCLQSIPHHTETTMTTRLLPKMFALTLAAALSATWLSTVVTGMQAQSARTLHSIELPTVIVVAHKASAPQATAQAQATPGKNS